MRFGLMIRSIEFFWQRLTRGWDDSDTWSLDEVIAKFALPRFRRFMELTNGYPSDVTEEEYTLILEKIEYALSIAANQNYDELTMEEQTKVAEGLELFGKYFRTFWW